MVFLETLWEGAWRSLARSVYLLGVGREGDCSVLLVSCPEAKIGS